MRELHGHKVNPANDVLKIEVTDEPGAGGAHHRYEITGFDTATNPSLGPTNGEPKSATVLLFQNGPIAEVGVNGITHEALIAILIDRLEAFQAWLYTNQYNASALFHLKLAQQSLLARTQERMSRNVEGTHAQ